MDPLRKPSMKVPNDYEVGRFVRQLKVGKTWAALARTSNPITSLRVFMRVHGLSQEQMAKELRVSQSTLSLLMSGKREPSEELRERLSTMCEIPEYAWRLA